VHRREQGTELAALILALNIRAVGKTQARAIADAFQTFPCFWAALDGLRSDVGRHPATEPWDVVDSIGKHAMAHLIVFANQPGLAALAVQLAALVPTHTAGTANLGAGSSSHQSPVAAEPAPLAGLSVVFTGKFVITGWSREQCKVVARQLGATKTPASLSTTTDLFVVGAKPGASKLALAAATEVRTISEGDFIRMIGKAADYGLA
jgi:NAD-dependent DNA ligase